MGIFFHSPLYIWFGRIGGVLSGDLGGYSIAGVCGTEVPQRGPEAEPW